MTTLEVNEALSAGNARDPGVLPKLDALSGESIVFAHSFGLDALPDEPGIIIVRGARQYGKSTWLQRMIRATVDEYGPGSAFYLNGDEIRDQHRLSEEIRALLPLYRADAAVRRLFVDEITSIPEWERTLKILADQGELRRVLVVTTGSHASDLRHGAERLPGRKGRLGRTSFVFTPIPFPEFRRAARDRLAADETVPAYLLSGGSPIACAELIREGRLPDFVIELVRDWVYGAFARSGRSRSSLLGVLECLFRFAGTPVGQSRLAREAGLANNTVAAGYADELADLLALGFSHPWDADRRRPNRRRPCKYHFTNTLVASAWHPLHPRTPRDLLSMPADQHGAMLEWAVAQELFRRACIRAEETPEILPHWSSRDHEIDFVASGSSFLEVKRGAATPLEFAWFARTVPKARLTVINTNRFETDRIRGITMEDFLTCAG